MSRRDHQHHHHQFDDDDGDDHQIDGRGDDHKEDCGGVSGCGVIKSVHVDVGNVRCSVSTGVDDEAADVDENNLMNSFILIYSIL